MLQLVDLFSVLSSVSKTWTTLTLVNCGFFPIRYYALKGNGYSIMEQIEFVKE